MNDTDILERLKLLTQDKIAEFCTERVLFKAEDYLNKVSNIRIDGNTLFSSVQGSEYRPYKIQIKYSPENDKFVGECSCPAEMDFCKHIIATLLVAKNNPKLKQVTILNKDFNEYLSKLTQEDLIELIKDYSKKFDEIRKDLSLKIAKDKGGKIDVREYIDEINHSVSDFIDYYQMHEFIGELEVIYNSIEKLSASFPEDASEILEYFIKRCIKHYENCDDSDGLLGEFIDKLMELHSNSLKKFNCNQKKLTEWIIYQWENNDYGFGDNLLEIYGKALKVEGLNILRDRFSLKLKVIKKRVKPTSKWETRYEYSSTKEFLLGLYDLLGDDKSFFELAESSLKESSDYLILVKKLIKLGRIDEAIQRCKGGLKKRDNRDLFAVLADLYKQKGDYEKELLILEELFKLEPSEELMTRIKSLATKLGEWEEYKKGIIKTLNNEEYYGLLVKIYMEDKDYENLIKVALHKDCDRIEKEKIAKFVVEKFPEKAIKIYQDIILDYLNEMGNYAYKKSAKLLVELRKIYYSNGKRSEWLSYFGALKIIHKAKRNFMSELIKVGLIDQNIP